jgi:CRP-like cAMP-binding protein
LVLATLGAGDCIGEMSLLDNQPHSASVVADTQIDALALSRDGFNSCILHNSHMAVAVMRGLVMRLRKANQKIASLALFSVFGRVARYLLDLVEEGDSHQLIVKKKISHAAIAREVGASREMVSKALKEFEAQGFIHKLEDGTLVVTERRTKARI